MIYISAAISFLLGDLTMAIGRNVFSWSLAAFGRKFTYSVYHGRTEYNTLQKNP